MGRDLSGTKARDEFIAALKPFESETGALDNISVHAIVELFARRRGKEPKYYADDIIDIGPEDYPNVKPKSHTTCGRYLFNKFIVLPLGAGVFSYMNFEITSKKFGDLEDLIAEALKDRDITQAQVCEFIDRSQYLLGGPLSHIINPSISPAIMTLPPQAKKLKKELIAENLEKIDAGDPQASSTVERAVTKVALDSMLASGDPAIAYFESGAIDPYNNYRTMFVMKGAIADNTGQSPTGYKVVKSDYDTGLTKEDLPKIADSVVTSSYSSGVATQDSGYAAKKYNVVFQNVVVADPGTDCGTKRTFKTKITNRHMYMNIVEGGKLILLTPDNMGKYLGTVRNLRVPLYCTWKDPGYCAACCGDRLHRIGIKNVGQTFNTMSGSTLNAALKKKHDVSVKFYDLTVDDLLKYVE